MVSAVCHFLESPSRSPHRADARSSHDFDVTVKSLARISPRLKSAPSGRNGTRVFFHLKTRRIVDSSARSRIGHAVASWTREGKGDPR